MPQRGFREANAVALGVPAVDVVEDDGPMAMAPERAIEAKDREVAFEPAGLTGQGLADDAAFAQAVAADEDEQLQVAVGKGLDDPLQLEVGRQVHPAHRGFRARLMRGTRVREPG